MIENEIIALKKSVIILIYQKQLVVLSKQQSHGYL